MTDPYVTLGVRPDADQDVIRAAYRALARLHHPDIAGAAGEARMKAITAAWAILADPVRRAEWDSRNVEPPAPPPPSPAPARTEWAAATMAGTFQGSTTTPLRPLRPRTPPLRPEWRVAGAAATWLACAAFLWHSAGAAPPLAAALAYLPASLPTGVRGFNVLWRVGVAPSKAIGAEVVPLALLHLLGIVVLGVVFCPVEIVWLLLLRPLQGQLCRSWERRA